MSVIKFLSWPKVILLSGGHCTWVDHIFGVTRQIQGTLGPKTPNFLEELGKNSSNCCPKLQILILTGTKFTEFTVSGALKPGMGQFHQCSMSSFCTHRSWKPKNTDYLTVFFALSGSVCVKAACRMLLKLTPGLNFTNVLRTAFALVDPNSEKNSVISVFLHFWDLWV